MMFNSVCRVGGSLSLRFPIFVFVLYHSKHVTFLSFTFVSYVLSFIMHSECGRGEKVVAR